mmetsp:Transcript_31896/g.53796  ORF Transcript_31896/g.53796 Transcript_31896/m.53796 type:complete len:216 (-) Transcript_31896:356-1003(-)
MFQTTDVGDEAPDFNLDSQLGRVAFHDIIDGKWCLLVTFASAFDPVATTDFGMLSKLKEEFEARNISIITVGNDAVPNYRRWIKDIEELQTTRISFPLLSDPDCSVLNVLGCARPSLLNEKDMKPVSSSYFLIDVDKRVRHSSRASLLIGRNWYEPLRQYDALTLTTEHKVVCPANWGSGQDVLVHPEVTAEEAAEFRYVEIRPWFKLTKSPADL